MRCEIEDCDAESAFDYENGRRGLEAKWLGLRVLDEDTCDGLGEIVDFEWTETGGRDRQWAAVVEFESGLEAYCYLDLPELAMAAEDSQSDDVELEYEEHGDEFDTPGDGELQLMAAHVNDDDDDDDDDATT